MSDNALSEKEGKKNRKTQTIAAIISGILSLIATVIAGSTAISVNQMQKQWQSQIQNQNMHVYNYPEGKVATETRTDAVQVQGSNANAVQGTTAPKPPATTQPQFVWLEEVPPMSFYTMGENNNGKSNSEKNWKWERKDTDNTGETYEHGIYFNPTSAYFTLGYVQLDLPVTKYSKITGTLVLTQDSKDKTRPSFFEVYDGNNLIDTIEEFNAGFVPKAFSYDLDGVDRLTFKYLMKENDSYLDNKAFGLVNTKLFY